MKDSYKMLVKTGLEMSCNSFTCPKKVDKDNWIGGDSYDDKFSIIQIGKMIQVTRTDSNEGWAMNLKIKCCR